MFFLYSGFVLENLAILLLGISLMATLVLFINNRRRALRFAMAGNMVALALVMVSFSTYFGSVTLQAVKTGTNEVKSAWYDKEQTLDTDGKPSESRILFKVVYSLYSFLAGK